MAQLAGLFQKVGPATKCFRYSNKSYKEIGNETYITKLAGEIDRNRSFLNDS